jgi:hypothetical protein
VKRLVVIYVALIAIAGCTPTEEGAVIGAGTGAAVGAIATGDVAGAAVGGLIGAAAGAVIGRVSEGSNKCYYRDEYGRRYVDRCPSGY